jgi:anti-sigma factor RsiW
MMGCNTWGHEVMAYLDGELRPPGKVARFEEHLPSCEACRKALEAQRWLNEELAGLPQVETSAQFEAGFWARLARTETDTALRSGWFGWLRAPALAPAVRWGLGAAVLGAALFLAYPGSKPPLEADWAIVAEAEDFELALDTDPQLLEVLDVLEAWDGS